MVIHEIAEDESGSRHGTDGKITVTLQGTEGTMFKRRAVKNACTPDAAEVCWLVTVLNGVCVYQQGDNIIVTTQDLYP